MIGTAQKTEEQKENDEDSISLNVLVVDSEPDDIDEVLELHDTYRFDFTEERCPLAVCEKAILRRRFYQVVIINAASIADNLHDIIAELRQKACYRRPVIIVLNADVDKFNHQDLLDAGVVHVNSSSITSSVLDQAINLGSAAFSRQQNEFFTRLVQFKPKILLVEDDKINQQVAEMNFRNFPCDYDIVETGNDALAKLNDNQYDIILLDIGLPDIDGYEVTSTLRAQENECKDLTIIAVTAFVSRQDVLKCYEVGVNDVIIKPFGINDLKYVLALHLVTE